MARAYSRGASTPLPWWPVAIAGRQQGSLAAAAVRPILTRLGGCGALCAATCAVPLSGRARNQQGEETFVTTASGLRYVDYKAGDGESPVVGSYVQVHYTGALADGTKFDSSRDRGRPHSFFLGRGKVIQGWDEGILSMRVGGRRKLVIPPELGYGPSCVGPIPPNAVLVFDCELVSIGVGGNVPPDWTLGGILDRLKGIFKG